MNGLDNERFFSTFPLYALSDSDGICAFDFEPLEPLAPGGCASFYSTKELGELAVSQADKVHQGTTHGLHVINDKKYLIEVLEMFPKDVQYLILNKALHTAGDHRVQVVSDLLRWLKQETQS